MIKRAVAILKSGGLFKLVVSLVVLTAVLTPIYFVSRYRDSQVSERVVALTKDREAVDTTVKAECAQSSKGRVFNCEVLVPASGEAALATVDLKAQQDMAAAAVAMFLASLAGLIVTTIGVVYVALTLRETQRMVQHTEAATKAAETANLNSREIGRAQARAYLSVPDGKLEFHTDHGFLFVRVHNAGQSPARDVRITTHFLINSTSPMFTYRQPVWRQLGTKTLPILAAGESDSAHYLLWWSVLEHELRENGARPKEYIANGVASFWVRGTVRYRTVFESDHFAHFSLMCHMTERGVSEVKLHRNQQHIDNDGYDLNVPRQGERPEVELPPHSGGD